MDYQKIQIPIYLKNEKIGTLTIKTSNLNCDESFFENELGKFHNINLESPDNKTPIQYCDLGFGQCIMLLEETKYQVNFISKKKFQNIKVFPKLLEINDNAFEQINTESKNNVSGILNFGSYAGKSFFNIEVNDHETELIPFEVRSKKINYHKQYITMIGDLAKAMSGILFYQNSSLFQHFIQGEDSKKTSYENYMFLEYLFLDDNLPYAYEYIRKNIYVNLKEKSEIVPSSFASNVGYASIISIVCNPEYLQKSKNPPLNWPSSMKNYIPDKINQTYFEESVDTPENRLLKYLLEAINNLTEKLLIDFPDTHFIRDRLIFFENKILDYLSDSWLEDVGTLEMIPMNSQVLQKKEGYRDIFKYFLNFELGYRPIWKEVEELINGYERELSNLYEIWCYFKLLKIMEKISGQKINYEDIFEINKSIKLKTDTLSILNFKINVENTELLVNIYYQKKFKTKGKYKSYSLGLEPDYTLEIILNEHFYYLHFDAKYRSNVNHINEETTHYTHKNEDIYKMHAYKDAILNTLGSYTLYPGDISKIYCQEDKKIINSVGAFPLKPGENIDQEITLQKFLINFFKTLVTE